MPDRDSLGERGRALEDEYFWRKDRELLEKIRQAKAADAARQDLERKTGLDDPALVQELQELGFTVETVDLLPLVPVLQVAWAEGGITAAERELILRIARSRGIEAGGAADRRLTEWMATAPSDAVFAGARRLIRAMLASGSAEATPIDGGDLVKLCEEIASASGGVFGMRRVSSEERELLAGIAADLAARRS
jgi:hypothetical protein